MVTNGNNKSDKGVEMSSMKVTTTNKRELQFAIESWQEIGESLSRLRPRNRVVESYTDKGDRDEDDQVRCSGSRRPKTMNNRVQSKLKELLRTGLLEGLDIWYIRGVKGGTQSSIRLASMIKGTNILFFCDDCQGFQVISPTKFEIHAGSANKRPADYIYLDNQSSLRDVLNACIRTAISSAPAPPQSQTSISLTLQAGDCVLMRPSDIGKPPYVACVKKIEADSRNNVEVRVRWYYRPKESLGGRRQFHGAKELFLSDHFDIQSAHTIEGKYTVHSFKNYTKLENVGTDDYFCRFEYKAATGAFTPDRVVV